MNKEKLAILVSKDYRQEHPHPDDALLCHALRQSGQPTDILVWDLPEEEFSSYGAAIIRSCWDYDQRVEEFLRRMKWLEENLLLLNPFSILQSNCDKRYLLELEKRGVPIVPTQIVSHLPPDLSYSCEKVIVKPTVSASGKNTFLFPLEDREGILGACERLQRSGKIPMLQPYLSTIERFGEHSSVVIDREVTFTMKKTPAPGNYLVHQHLGGTYTPWSTSPEEREFIELLLDKLEEIPLYMRIDYLQQEDGSFLLLELEEIEPNLYLGENDRGLSLLVQGIRKRLAQA